MRVLALDPSETSCGFAVWGPDDVNAASGAWTLGSEFTGPGAVFGRLHENMTGLHQLGRIDAIFFERPRHLEGWNKESNANSHLIMVGLAAHILSWGEAMGCRMVRDVAIGTWRAHFLRGMNRPSNADGSKITGILKDMAIRRAREIGFRPSTHDQAEALGILDYACDALRLSPPWRRERELALTPTGRF